MHHAGRQRAGTSAGTYPHTRTRCACCGASGARACPCGAETFFWILLAVKTNDTPSDVTDVIAKPGGAAPERLADIAREADMLDTSPEREQHAGQVAESAQVVANNESELLVTLQAIRAMAFPMLAMVVDEGRMSALGQVWNDGVLGASAAAGAAVLEKHGWSMGSLMGDYGCYVMLVAALAPPVVMTKKILEAPKEKPRAPAPAPAPAADGQQQ
ncbi:MAG: hypothetical protein V4645_18210 [Pseudomonadota bacterium]